MTRLLALQPSKLAIFLAIVLSLCWPASALPAPSDLDSRDPVWAEQERADLLPLIPEDGTEIDQRVYGNELVMSGHFRWEISGGRASMSVEKIANRRASGSLSGSLELRLWASSNRPIYGQQVHAYTLASHRLQGLHGHNGDQLKGGYSVSSYYTGSLAYKAPPSGCYFMAIALLEWKQGQFYYMDFVTFDQKQGFGGSQCKAPPPPSPTTCTPSSTRLCLNRGRFQVTVDWRTPAGASGVGRVVGSPSDVAANLWFFKPENWEMLVKVLDGCGVNNRYWVFFAATTNVQFVLDVVDTATGQRRTYANPMGQPANTVADDRAFATCP